MTELKTFGIADLQAYLDAHQIPGEILILARPTPTVETAAQAVGALPDQIVKSILFLLPDQPVLAVSCGLGRIDRRVIAKYFGVGRKRVKLADAETVLRVLGYPVGTVPPFGHRQQILTLLDQPVLAHEQVYAGGGEHNALVRLPSAEILKHTQAEVLDLQHWPQQG